ncbi:MAG: purine-nucleoside phosphorylase [bacterium]|nr:purine-nucleoside phosphorylase [bacterium]
MLETSQHPDLKPILDTIHSRWLQANPGKLLEPVELGVVLGSGLGALAEQVENPVIIPTNELPDYPVSTVPGHAGKLYIGSLAGRRVALLSGRIHYYEGYTPQQVVMPVRMLRGLGATGYVVTNASGGIRDDLTPGTLMRITDHINFIGMNPLRGLHNPELGPRFPDLTNSYTAEWGKIADTVADELQISLRQGILGAMSGPTYETPAEVRMWRTLGVDAACMSTVPEVMVATAMGMKVLGISCITNRAAGLSTTPLTHEEVTIVANQVREKFVKLLLGVLPRLR